MKTTVADIVDLWNRMPSHIFRQWMKDNYDRLINESSPKEPSKSADEYLERMKIPNHKFYNEPKFNETEGRAVLLTDLLNQYAQQSNQPVVTEVKHNLTVEEIENIEPSKIRVNKQLDDLGITNANDRSVFHNGVLFTKGYYYQDGLSLQHGTESDAVEFDDWLSDNGWYKPLRTHPNKLGQYYSDQFGFKTIQEIYDLFTQSKGTI